MYKVNTWLAAADEHVSGVLYMGEVLDWRRRLVILITRSGDGLPFLLFLGALVLFGSPQWRVIAISLFLADVLTFLVVQTLKFLIRRGRPAGEWGQMYRRLDPYSFPSGHSARGGAMAAMSLLVAPTWFGLILLAWGLAVALSRVLLGVHYFSDAVSGFALGVAMSLALWLFVVG